MNGTWIPVHLKQAPYLPAPSNSNASSFCSQISKNGGYDTYRYVPRASAADDGAAASNSRSCHFTAWNKDMFCAIIRYATVLIVGDSLSGEHYASLVGLLGVRAYNPRIQFMSWNFNTNVGHAVCGGNAQVVYRRDDHLTNLRHAIFENGTHVPQILVLNRGAHYVRDVRYLKELRGTLDVVEEWLGRCEQMNIKCHFFWRTTVPGHVNCHDFPAPVNDKATMEKHVANLSQYNPEELRFHWYDFQHQNLLAEAELARRNIRHQILDGYHINVLRPDQHTDCLHSCGLGKTDVYPQLMLHYLRNDRTLEDVHRLRSVFDDNHWTVNVTTEFVPCPGGARRCRSRLSPPEASPRPSPTN